MHIEGLNFLICKSFAEVHLFPLSNALRIVYLPVVNGRAANDVPGFTEIVLPIEAIGRLWATTRAFLYGMESLDENVMLRSEGSEDFETLVKLYRDKPRGENGALNGEEVCWLRIVTGRSEEERRRIKLGSKDLVSLELACNAVLVMSCGANVVGTSQPAPKKAKAPQAA